MYIQGNHKIETGFYKNSKRQYIKTWLFDSTSLTWLRHGVWTGWYANGNTTYTETYDTDAMILDKCRYWQVNGTERTEKTLNRKKAVVRITKQPSLFTNEFSDSNSAESSELGEWSEVEQTEDILREILGNPDDNNFSNSDWKQESDFGFGFGFRLDFKDGEIWNGLKMKEI
jgi:antitoxin component YwqK of YwqJK toxin-antitoxin module